MILLVSIQASPQTEDLSKTFQLKSEYNQETYEIEIVFPFKTLNPGIKYPVIYCMDWFILGDYLKSLPKLMKLGNLVEPYIMVGISQGSTHHDWATMRTRDLTPANPEDEYSRNNMYSQALDKTGGAGNYAMFLKNKLVPFIENKYPIDDSKRCFVGYSLGGLFGIYSMKYTPTLFQYYLIGSPSLWFNNYYLSSELEKLSSDQLSSIKKIYLSVGEEESWEMLKSYALLRSIFLKQSLSDKHLKMEIIPNSGHVGAMPISLYNGVRFLFRND